MNRLKETLQGLATELGVEKPVPSNAEGLAGAVDSGPSGVSGPAPAAGAAADPERESEYGLFASAGRLYVQNAAGKVIDIGDILEEGGVYAYRLDSGAISGEGFATLGDALRDLTGRLTRLYLDDLFQRLPDVAAEASMHSISVPAIRIAAAGGTDELRAAPGNHPPVE
jgi:hypothetical protein